MTAYVVLPTDEIVVDAALITRPNAVQQHHKEHGSDHGDDEDDDVFCESQHGRCGLRAISSLYNFRQFELVISGTGLGSCEWRVALVTELADVGSVGR